MPTVYRFTEFPRQIGFVATNKDEIALALTEALVKWARTVVTMHNQQTYLKNKKIIEVKQFDDADAAWDKAQDMAENLEEY